MRPTFSTEVDYVVLREIAHGAMGTVYEALQCGIEGFAKRVALKVLKPELTSLQELFTAEAHLVADLVHENIVQTYNLGEIDGQLFMTLELIEGLSLKDLLARHLELQVPLSIDLAQFLASRVARALEYAHTRRHALTGEPLGVVHRDVCPDNVLLTWEGVVKLSDFGVAKVRARGLLDDTGGNVLVGRARYMAPEQARLESTDARADVYSLGVLLYEMLSLTGRPTPRPRGGMLLPIRALNPDVPAALAEILQGALERDRDRRTQTAGALGLLLEEHLYQRGYGPTNLTLKAHLQSIYGDDSGSRDPGDSFESRDGAGTV